MKKTKKIPNTPKYKFGGGFDSKDKANVRNFIGNSAKMYADTALNAVGVDAFGAGKGVEYKGTSANKFNQASNVTGKVSQAIAPAVANVLLPGSGQFVSMGQQVAGGAYGQFGPQNEEGFNAYDDQGNPIMNEGDKSAQVAQIAGQVGSMASGFMGGSPGGMPSGATPAMVAKYGGYMKYTMGGQEPIREYATKDGNNINYYKKVNTPSGPRFYTSSSPDMSTAQKITNFKINKNSADSIPMKDLPSNVKSKFINFAMGGMQYANGGTGEMNAEVEKEENAVGPNNEFTQFDGPSHSQGGIKTDMAPGTKVFSDKLKAPGTNKTFAKLNASNNTNREDKLDTKEYLDPKSKMSIDLTRMAKMKNSDMLFAMQEQLKKNKVAAYAKRMGVELPSMDNEQMEPQGMPEQAEGEMAMVKYGGMMNRMAMGGVQLPYYNINSNGMNKYAMGGMGVDPAMLAANTGTVAPTMSTPPQFDNRMEFDKYYQSQGFAKDPRNKLGSNVTYYNPNKYKYDQGTDSFKFANNEPVPYNSLPSSDLMEFKPGSGVQKVVNKKVPVGQQSLNKWDFNSGTPTKKYYNESGELLKSEEYDNAGPNGKVINTIEPRRKLAYGGRMPKYANAGTVPVNGSMVNAGSAFTLNSNAIGDDVVVPGTPESEAMDGYKLMGLKRYNDVTSSLPSEETEPTKKTPFDWKDAAGQAANFIGQNAGNIYDLTRKNEPLTTYDRAQAKYLDPTQARKDEQYNYRQSLENVRTGSMGSGATLLANTNAARNRASTNTARINQAYDDANAQIGNQVNQYNTNISMQEKIAREANAAALENTRSKAIHGLGESFGKGTKSGKQTEMDQKELGMFQWRYQNEPGFKAHVDNFSKNKKGK
jgi:hypothetical protein